MTMTEQAKHANELSSETSITFLSRRYGAETDPTHTHELVMRAELGTECREYVFQTDKGRNAAHSLLSQIMGAQQLDELLGMMLAGAPHLDGDQLEATDSRYEAKFDGLHELGETGVHVYESDTCAADGEFGEF